MTLVESPHVSAKGSNEASYQGKKVVKIAVGSSAIGSHSMAIDDGGNLYGWGVAYAIGLGVVKAIVSPTYIAVGTIQHPLNQSTAGDNDDDGQSWYLLDDDPANSINEGIGLKQHSCEDLRYITDVACGGGFTVCVTRAGHVFSWGE
jgi:alpha-tubulin suppressor-like RCC1 family protein